MPAGELSGAHLKGLLGPSKFPRNGGAGSWPSMGKSGWCGSLNFFLGGENGDK